MWLSDYLHKRWGLFFLVGGTTLLALGLWGRSTPAPRRPRPDARPASAALKAEPTGPKKPTVAAVTRLCTERGVPVDRPPQPRPQAVSHPGFPPPTTAPPALGPEARGLFPLRKRLAGQVGRRLVHAPLIHRLARGFALRYHYFRSLAENRRAARRYYRQRAERRRSTPRPPTAAGAGPRGAGQPPPSSVIALQARTYRKSSLGYYRELVDTRTLAGYRDRPQALLELATLLMSPLPRVQPQASHRAKHPRKGAAPGGADKVHTEGLRVLHRLLAEHPRSNEAIEAMALLAHRAAARDRCAKVIFLGKTLSVAPLPRRTPPRRARLRGLVHYHAGRCLLQRGAHAAAAQRLARAVADARLAPKGGALAREAALLWAQAYAAAGELTQARAHLAALGPDLAPQATAVLVSLLLRDGQLAAGRRLCTPPRPAPRSAK